MAYVPRHRLCAIRRLRLFEYNPRDPTAVCDLAAINMDDKGKLTYDSEVSSSTFLTDVGHRLEALVCSRALYVVDTRERSVWLVSTGRNHSVALLRTEDDLGMVRPSGIAESQAMALTIASNGSAIWACGGEDLGFATARVWRLDFPSQRWNTEFTLPYPLAAHTITYVPARSANRQPSHNTNLAIQAAQMEANQMKADQTEADDDAGVTMDDKPVVGGAHDTLVVVGGNRVGDYDPFRGPQYVDRCFYAVLADQPRDLKVRLHSDDEDTPADPPPAIISKPGWMPFARLNAARGGHGTALFDGCLVVAGGIFMNWDVLERQPVRSVEVLQLSNPQSGWVEIGPLPSMCHPHRLRLITDEARLFAVETQQTSRDVVNLFDITPGRSETNSMPLTLPDSHAHPDTITFVPIF